MVENCSLILLLEPDEAVRAALASLLRQHGWQIEAHSEAGGLADDLDGLSPSVLVAESNLPDMAAAELLDLCKAARVPVIFLGHGREIQHAVDLMRRGATDFLEKPFPQKRLLEALEGLRPKSMQSLG
ncbi:MAG TPA: response regulator [Xanthomonadales bacterium]|nr:response regulator [Xanthomonadales bacterium]